MIMIINDNIHHKTNRYDSINFSSNIKINITPSTYLIIKFTM